MKNIDVAPWQLVDLIRRRAEARERRA